MSKVGAANPFLEAMVPRRSIYKLSKEAVVPDDRVVEIVNHAIKYTPCSFNAQTVRAIVLFENEHDKLWDMTKEVLTTMLGAEKMQSGGTNGKMAGFKAARGTILFFDDDEIVNKMRSDYELYAHNFGPWAQQSNGMAQYVIWTALANEGVGCNLQHYNEVIEQKAQAAFDIPVSWKMSGQMPFGKPEAPAGDDKEFMPLDKRVRVIGKK